MNMCLRVRGNLYCRLQRDCKDSFTGVLDYTAYGLSLRISPLQAVPFWHSGVIITSIFALDALQEGAPTSAVHLEESLSAAGLQTRQVYCEGAMGEVYCEGARRVTDSLQPDRTVAVRFLQGTQYFSK